MWRWMLALVVLLAAAVGIVVGWLNPGEVVVDLLIASFEIPLGVLILASLAAGAAAGLVFGVILAWTGRRRKSRGKGDAGSAKVVSPSPAPHD